MTFRAYNALIIALGLAVLILAVVSCKRSPDTPPTKSSFLIVNVSGLGNSTGSPLDPIVAMERISFPDVTVGYFPTNGWLTNVADYCRRSEYSKIVLLGHSFGADRAARTAAELPRVDLLILIDPVAFGAGNDTVVVPPSVQRCIVFRRKTEGAGVLGVARRANIEGRVEIHNLDLGHSEMCSNNEVMATIQSAITEAIQ